MIIRKLRFTPHEGMFAKVLTALAELQKTAEGLQRQLVWNHEAPDHIHVDQYFRDAEHYMCFLISPAFTAFCQALPALATLHDMTSTHAVDWFPLPPTGGTPPPSSNAVPNPPSPVRSSPRPFVWAPTGEA